MPGSDHHNLRGVDRALGAPVWRTGQVARADLWPSPLCRFRASARAWRAGDGGRVRQVAPGQDAGAVCPRAGTLRRVGGQDGEHLPQDCGVRWGVWGGRGSCPCCTRRSMAGCGAVSSGISPIALRSSPRRTSWGRSRRFASTAHTKPSSSAAEWQRWSPTALCERVGRCSAPGSVCRAL